MSSTYISQPIDENILSVLDVDESGKIVTSDAWTHLWGLVFNRINNIDIFCTTVETLVTNWQTTKKIFDEAVVHINEKYAALEQGFVHYGEQAPTDPSTKLWVKPVGDISPDTLATRLFVAESIIPVASTVENHTVKLARLDSATHTLQNKISQTEAKLNSAVQNFNHGFSSIEAELSEQQIGINELTIRAATAESDITELRDIVSRLDIETALQPEDIAQQYDPQSNSAQSGVAVAEAIAQALGDVEAALDSVLAIQDSLIDGQVVSIIGPTLDNIITIQNTLIGGDSI